MLQRRDSLLAPILLLATVPATASTWLETRAEFEQLAEADDFEAAAALGPELLESARETFGADSQQLADSHMLLARLNRAAGEFYSAEDNFFAAISIIVNNDGPDSTALIEPYTELGESYFLADDFQLALVAFEEARTKGRREFGLLNPEQIPILDRMSQAAEALGDLRLAKGYQETMFSVARRHYGPDSLESLEAGYILAEWFSDHLNFPEARYVVMDNQKIIDEYFDGDPKLTIERLRFAYEHVPRYAPGTVPPVELYQAVEIVEALAVPDPQLHASILVDIGDWMLYRGRHNALDRYREAWDVLGTFEGGEALRQTWFTELVPVTKRFSFPDDALESRYLTEDSSAPEGFVTLGFNIDTAGHPRQMHVIAADPPNLLDRAAIEHVSELTFRPQIIGGEFVQIDNRLTLNFRYELDEIEEQADGQ